MSSLNTILYASSNNGGKAGVSIGDVAGLVGEANQAAAVTQFTSVGPGTPANAIVDVTVTPTQATINANFASLATKVDAIIAALVNAGLMA